MRLSTHIGVTDAAHEGYRPLFSKAAGEKELCRIPLELRNDRFITAPSN